MSELQLKAKGITDAQCVALMQTVIEIPIIATLDLRENSITDIGVRAILEVMRQQLLQSKRLCTGALILPQPLEVLEIFSSNLNN